MTAKDVLQELKDIRRENLKRFAVSVGSKSKLADMLGKSPSQINDMIQGTKSFGDKIAREIEQRLNMLPGTLDRPITEGLDTVDIFDPTRRRIPVLNNVQAGELPEIGNCHYDEWIDIDIGCSKEAFGLRIVGDSMLPEFREGDLVIIDPEIAPVAGDYVVVRSLTGKMPQAAFKRYALRGYDDEGRVIFEAQSLNSSVYPNYDSQEYNLEVVGTMYEHRRRRRP